jgi:uncharacterized protein
MRQNWWRLLFLHWSVPVEMLWPLIPAPLALDTFEGRAWIGLVPFTMTGVRPWWSPSVPWISDFHETNVRTYVHHAGRDPGLWFFSLEAANPVAVRIARAMWRLPYHYARMGVWEYGGLGGREGPVAAVRPNTRLSERLLTRRPDDPTTLHYRSERVWPPPVPATCAVTATPTGTPAPATPGTLEYFLAERYFLYSSARGRLYKGQVHHTPYPLQTAEVHSLEENLIAAAGIIRPDQPPLAHFAAGVRTWVFPLRRIL